MMHEPTGTALGAVVNKLLVDRGRSVHFDSPAELGRAIFDGSPRVDLALQVLTALVLLAAAGVTLVGVYRLVRGIQGGADTVAGGVFGMLGLLAALSVVM